MKTTNWLVLGLSLSVLGGFAMADEKETAKLLVGKWEATKVDEGSLPKGAIVEFMKDGKMKVSGKKGDDDLALDGTYKLNGMKLTVTLKMPDGGEKEHPITIKKISDTEMSVEGDDGKSITFTRKK